MASSLRKASAVLMRVRPRVAIEFDIFMQVVNYALGNKGRITMRRVTDGNSAKQRANYQFEIRKLRIFRSIKRFILAFLLALAPGVCAAENFYISQSGSGDGSSCSSSLSASWFNSLVNWGVGAGKVGPGDTVHICGTISSQLAAQGSGAAGSPVTILFESGAKIQPLTSCDDNGCINIANKSYMVVDGGTECGYVNGVDVPCNGAILNTNQNPTDSSKGVVANNCQNCEVKNLDIGYLCVLASGACPTSPQYYGIVNLGGNITGAFFKVHNNYVHDMPNCIEYIPSHPNDNGYEVFNNHTKNCSHHIDIATNGDYQTGYMGSALIHNNHVESAAVWDEAGCPRHGDGIYSWAMPGTNNVYVSGLQIYNNLVDGDWGNCPSSLIWTESGPTQGANTNIRIYNNVVMPSNYAQINNGMLSIGGYGKLEAYNNTIVGKGLAGSEVCMNVGSSIQGSATVFIENNLISNCSTLVLINNSTMPPITISSWDYNAYGGGGSSPWTNQKSSPLWYSTFSSWKVAYGVDAHSIYGAVANLKYNANGSLQSDSPARGAGANLSSLGIAYLNMDKIGGPRPQELPWDIGAFEYVSGAVMSPTNIRIIQ